MYLEKVKLLTAVGTFLSLIQQPAKNDRAGSKDTTVMKFRKLGASVVTNQLTESYWLGSAWREAEDGSTTRLQPEVMPSKSPKSRTSKESKNKPHTKQPSSEIKEFQAENMSQLLDVTIAGISAVQTVVPSDLAKGILSTVTNILITVQLVIKNKSDFWVIVKKCQTIGEILKRVTKDTTDNNLPRYLVVSRKEQGLLKRFFSDTNDRNQIASWEKDIGSALELFNTEVNAGMAMRLEGLILQLDGNPMNVNVLNMGKSSLAKAILHEPLIIEKFADWRFFVAYDDLDPLTVTFETFMTHFTGALGIEITGADPLHPISTFLHSTSALIVLDNAETFEEASALSALEKIPPAIAKIADIHGIILILTSCS
ncbi:hypothetical protein BDR06DRAFT_993956 [Suillus hirtellus]|nr:hypothetical protein BDR06DRAFT_993956 [Suillus hirtellus]